MSDKNNEVSDTMSTSSATSSLSPPFSDPPKPWYRDPMVSSTVVIASATVVNLFVSCGLWISTKDSVDVTRAIFETANRPYVGLQGVGIVPDSDKSGGVSIVATIRNFGTVPAYNFDATWEVSLGGEVLPGTRVPQNRSTLSPGNSVSLPGHLNGPTFNKVLNGERLLKIITRIAYKGPTNKDYQYCEKSQYDSDFNAFMNLGACDDSNG